MHDPETWKYRAIYTVQYIPTREIQWCRAKIKDLEYLPSVSGVRRNLL